MTRGLRRLLHLADLDRDVFLGVAEKAWLLLSGPLSILFILRYYSEQVQGFHYTFASILAFRTYLDLGMPTVAIQFVSHEWAHLGIDADGNVVGDGAALSRLTSLVRQLMRWFLVGGILIAVGLSVGGYLFLASGRDASAVAWRHPWIAVAVLSGIDFALIPCHSVLVGSGRIGKVFAFRLVDSLVSRPLMWLTIILGGGLWASVVLMGSRVVLGLGFLSWAFRPYWRMLWRTKVVERVSWSGEILPLQWKLAATAVCGYFAFTLFTPMVYRYCGAEMAGQVGISLNILTLLGGMVVTWTDVRFPEFGQLVAQRDYAELDRRFFRLCRISAALQALALGSFCVGRVVLGVAFPRLAARFMPATWTVPFAAALLLVNCGLPFTAYLRAHKREPIVLLMTGLAVAVFVSNYLSLRFSGPLAMGMGYMLIALLYFPALVTLWRKKRREWHEVAPIGGVA